MNVEDLSSGGYPMLTTLPIVVVRVSFFQGQDLLSVWYVLAAFRPRETRPVHVPRQSWPALSKDES